MFTSRVRLFTIGCALLVMAPSTFATITLELRPSSQTVTAGTAADVQLYVVSDVPGGEPVGKINAIIQFDPNRMTLLGHDTTGAPNWTSATFPASSSLNPDWTDGNALFSVTSNISPFPCGTLEIATSAGLLVTTFQFDVGSVIGAATVLLPATLGADDTEVYDALTILNCGGVPYAITLGPTVILNVVTCSGVNDCDDGTACTDDFCTAGVCSNPDNYDPATQCCDPANGMTLTIDDSNDCTNDSCNSATGQVTHLNKNFGVACGSSLNTSCTMPDTCNGMGVCQNNDVVNGNPCGDVNLCIDAGTCSAGVCSNPTMISADGTSCNDGVNCTEMDVCTAGVCGGTNPCSGALPSCFSTPGGFICGNCTSRFDCPGDFGCVTWDCLTTTSHICASLQNDVLCDDNLFCTATDKCQNDGTCTHTGSPCLTGAVCDDVGDACVECVVDADCKACDVSGSICLDTADCPAGETCVSQFDLCNPIVCNSGACEFGTPVTCTQTEECRINACQPANGTCQPKLPGQVACTQGTCPVGFNCDLVNFVCFRSAGCTDGNGCTSGDQCVNGTCVGAQRILNKNIEMRLVAEAPQSGGSFYAIGETISIRLELSIDSSVSSNSRSIRTVEAAMLWDPSVLGGAIAPTINDPCTGSINPVLDCAPDKYDWDFSSFSSVSDGAGLNMNLIDGDASYFAGIGLGDPEFLLTTSQDLWVTTFKFIAVGGTGGSGTMISLTSCLSNIDGVNSSNSRVIAGPNDQTGSLFSETIVIGCQSAADCNDNNACTTDVCEVNQACTNTPTYNPATECCNPANGTTTIIQDAVECTDDVCNTQTGAVTHPFFPNGQSCGNPASSQCDAQDTCDGFGVCVDRQQASGFACGDSSNTACTDPDTCDGNGICLTNDEASGTPCPDGLFCTGDETCLGGICQDAVDVDCSDDGVGCTINDFCDDTLDKCTGIPNDALCAQNEICDPEADPPGCIPFVSCDTPIVTAVGSRYFSIEPLPLDGAPTRFFITSPTWPCLAKFVGVPVGVDLDANGTIDGMAATLVDIVNDAGVLSPVKWSGSACDNLAPACTMNSECAVGGSCLPIMRCSESLEPCATTPDCPMGETCVPGKLYVTGPDITPSDRMQPPTQYRVQADCGGQPPTQTVQMPLFGDTDRSGIINASDITLAVQGFQGFYHRPVGEVGGSLRVSVDHRGTGTVCAVIVPPSVNAADITATIRSFQIITYMQEVAASGCSLPCP